MNIPRFDYPRPQLERENWICLNGEWDFEIDNAKAGEEKEFFKRESLDEKIVVPFCPESELSGIGNKDFMNAVWYRRDFDLPEERSERVILHFGAVDYHAKVFVNGTFVGEHKGGYSSFSFDITDALKDSGNYISVVAYDDTRSEKQCTGKQSKRLNSYGCLYTRTTGIWQTVWLECVDKCHIKNIRTITDIETPSANFTLKLSDGIGAEISAAVTYEGKVVGEGFVKSSSDVAVIDVKLSEKHLWELGEGRLYNVAFTVKKNGITVDEVKCYFGLRSVALSGKKFLLNGKSVFGRWVLDQGFYPDGIYTAPTDEALKNDIIYAMQLGFNGGRLHEKMFEERFLYWADRLGYMVWGEHANWGLDITEMAAIENFLPEWMETLERDFSHPSFIGWCPFNETWDQNGRKQYDGVIKMVYNVTKAIDPTRPCIDTSGNFHVVTDIFDVHDYWQNPCEFAEFYKDGKLNCQIQRNPAQKNRQTYDGKLPAFISEYGGARWSGQDSNSWGYGNAPKTEDEFIERYKGLTEAILFNENIMGFCYTQLYDVEQEVNGLLTYDRRFKFDPEIFRRINTQKAAIED